MNFLAIEKIRSLIFALGLIALGIVFIVIPGDSFNVLAKVIAWIAIVLGALMILYFFFDLKEGPVTILCIGILLLVLGIVALLFPDFIIHLIFLALCFVGIAYMALAVEAKKSGDKNWWQNLIYGIVQLALGIILIFVSYAAAVTIVMISIGVMFILDGIFIFVMMFLMKQQVKEIEKSSK